ncbi:hypothetical protein BTA51_28535 [Hahella sp. CCB-MM4]|uniref:hypothetical protein n=1 Tax=Hahella sp. (strain CCB-MM4) TaxID=1926491 RepID=UPI000B9BFC0C|nr:hypothetical protein [Hahella sp. CCB-MM4]OZG69959.1 hypothetical protein BTA51_28535 [Hahella sp. CCB-MM4]
MINKRELVKMLWGAINNDPKYMDDRRIASTNKNSFWKEDEWIWVKNIEMLLRKIRKEVDKCHASSDFDLVEVVVGCSVDENIDEYIGGLLVEVKESLKNITNPDV